MNVFQAGNRQNFHLIKLPWQEDKILSTECGEGGNGTPDMTDPSYDSKIGKIARSNKEDVDFGREKNFEAMRDFSVVKTNAINHG